MKNLIDLHVHTISSGHAYSTLLENITYAKNIDLKYLGISDHAPMMPGSAHVFHFNNLASLPSIIDGVTCLKGVELNILNENGDVDLSDSSLKRLDYAIASIHTPCFEGEDITTTYLNACNNKYISILGHIENGKYLCDFDKVCAYATKTNTLIELNNSSLKPHSSRVDANIHMPKLLEACKKNHTYVLIGSDAHFCNDIGNFALVEKLLDEYAFPKELVVNYDLELIEKFILKKAKLYLK